MVNYEEMLGRKGVDRITGFEGIAYAVTIHMSGCHQVCLIPTVDKDGKVRDAQWFDVQRVDLEPVAMKLDNGNTPGAGPSAPNPNTRRI